jgi:hypothetical protein
MSIAAPRTTRRMSKRRYIAQALSAGHQRIMTRSIGERGHRA